MKKEHYEDSIVFREVACLKAMKKPDEALKVLNQLIAHNKFDDTGYLNRARLYESLGKHKEAITDYSTSLDLSPSPTALKERASVFEKMGRKDMAEKDRKEADRM
jgi:tetratricopeptide (TPR) repeat protein